MPLGISSDESVHFSVEAACFIHEDYIHNLLSKLEDADFMMYEVMFPTSLENITCDDKPMRWSCRKATIF